MAKELGGKTRLLIGGTAVGQIESIQPPTRSRGETDVSDLESTIMEYLDHDLIDEGTLELLVYYDVTDSALETIFEDVDAADRDTTVELQYVKSARKDNFNGRILSLGPERFKSTDARKRAVTIRVTSAPIRTTIT